MEKKDFYEGQTVWIYLVGNAALRCPSQEKGYRNGKCFLLAESILHAIQKDFLKAAKLNFLLKIISRKNMTVA